MEYKGASDLKITTTRCVIYQTSADIIYIAEEAWNRARSITCQEYNQMFVCSGEKYIVTLAYRILTTFTKSYNFWIQLQK